MTTRSNLAAATALAGLIAANAVPAHADLWGDVTKTAKQVGEAAVKTVTVPTQTVIDTVQGRDPARASREAVQSNGRAVVQGADMIQRGHNLVYNTPRSVIRSGLGEDWEDAYVFLTTAPRLQHQMATTGARFAGLCMQGRRCNPEVVAAIPVSAALHDAYDVYAPHARPLPPDLKRAMFGVVPTQIIEDVRFVLGNLPDLTLPGFLNSAHQAGGSDHAVTIGNIVVFSRAPDVLDEADLHWVLHEVRHVQQYRELGGIDGFAFAYVKDWSALEDDAEDAADAWVEAVYDRLLSRAVGYGYGSTARVR